MAANSPLHQFMVYFRDCRVIAKTGHTIVVVYIIGGFGPFGTGLNLVKSNLIVKRRGERMNR